MIGSLTFWWSVKVLAGVALILHFSLLLFFPQDAVLLDPLFAFQPRLAQFLVLSGAGISLLHFFYLKKANPRLNQPDKLVCRGALFSLVRHPMYFGDLICYFGFFLLSPTLLALGLLLLAYFAIGRQSYLEDLWLAMQFPTAIGEWQRRSKRLVPFIW